MRKLNKSKELLKLNKHTQKNHASMQAKQKEQSREHLLGELNSTCIHTKKNIKQRTSGRDSFLIKK
jgi:hypothetical protein